MPHYKKAPIREALIDIKIQPINLPFEALHGLREHLNDYPNEETRNLHQLTVNVGSPSLTATQDKPYALAFRNSEGNQVVQFRLDGFTFSRLEPYLDWEHLRDEARRLWDVYRKFVGQQNVMRVELRYINVLNLSGDKIEPDEYLNTYPHVSRMLPAELRDYGPFLMRLPMLQHDLMGTLVITQSNAIPTNEHMVPIVLDLDLFVDNPRATNEQELWEFFERLRDRKNLYFEASITDKTRELIS